MSLCNTGIVREYVFYGFLNGVSTFTPRSIHISKSTFTRSPLAACYWPQPSHSLAAVHYGTRTAPYLMCIASLLNRRYLQVSGSVRVRVRVSVRVTARARVSAMVTVRDRDRI